MIGWLAAVLGGLAVVATGWRRRPVGRTRGERADRPHRRSAGLIVAVACGFGSLAVASGLPPAAMIATLGLIAAVEFARRRQVRSRVVAGRRSAVVELTYAVAGELRAGRGPIEAVRVALPGTAVDPPLGAALERDLAVASAASPGPALAEAAALPGAGHLSYLAAALAVAQASGGRVGSVLERLGAAMDSDEELRQELDAAMAGPRASMALLAGLPVLGIGLGQVMGAAPLRVLLHRPLGWALLVAGTLLDLAGVALVRLITRSALRP